MVDVKVLALALAGATKRCLCIEAQVNRREGACMPCTLVGGPHAHGQCEVEGCVGRGEDVYVLGAEVRVECMESCHAQGVTCKHTEQCHGWLPLDPYDMRWMVALDKLWKGVEVEFTFPYEGDTDITCCVRWNNPDKPVKCDEYEIRAYKDADTPWGALLMAAAKALGLEAEVASDAKG